MRTETDNLDTKTMINANSALGICSTHRFSGVENPFRLSELSNSGGFPVKKMKNICPHVRFLASHEYKGRINTSTGTRYCSAPGR
jgi:hypothetical protein